MQCPLCHSNNTSNHFKDKRRDYFQCAQCQLIYVPQNQHISTEAEKQRYDKHENNLNDTGYINHLQHFIAPLKKHISKSNKGLDFGSGPNPVFAEVMRKDGYEINIYDLFYANRPEVLQEKYDYITVCEVIEHLKQPDETLSVLVEQLNKQGHLAIMTQLYHSKIEFKNWWYKNDPTHIGFFSKDTFQWISTNWKLKIQHLSKNVIILQK